LDSDQSIEHVNLWLHDGTHEQMEMFQIQAEASSNDKWNISVLRRHAQAVLRSSASLAEKFERIRPHQNEAGLRLWAANEALSLGYGGVSEVARAAALSRTTIHVGIVELQSAKGVAGPGRIRRRDGGHKKLTEKDPGLLGALKQLVNPATRGDPESPLRWTNKSTTKLARELVAEGHPVSQRTVCDLLTSDGYPFSAFARRGKGRITRTAMRSFST
jgi:hypothetical protein